MALLDEAIGGELLTAGGLAVSVLVLKRFAPDLSPPLRSLAVSGLQLFAEAEFETQDGIIAKLAQRTVESLIKTIPSGASPQTGDATRTVVRNFERTARGRSRRHAWNDRDRNARYRHHVGRLKAAVEHASRNLSPAQQNYLTQAMHDIAEEW